MATYYNIPTEEETKSGDLAWILWWNRIRACQQFRKNNLYGERMWARYYRIFKGIQWDDIEDIYDISSTDLPEQITVNVTASTILTIMPFLVNQLAEFKCEARKPGDAVNARLKQEMINYEWERKGCQKQMLKSLYDWIIIGHGIQKTGFTRSVDEAATKRVGAIEYDDMIEDESAYSKRVDPMNFWWDYSAPEKNIETGRFTIERYFKYIPDLLQNNAYDSKVRSKIEAGDVHLATARGMQYEYNQLDWLMDFEQDSYESEMAILYEIWDKKYQQVLTFIEGVIEPIKVINTPYPYLKSFFPYEKADFIYQPNEYYGCGIPRFIEAQQYELNRHRTFAFNHRRRFSARKYEVLQDVDPEEVEKLPDAEDGTYIMVPQLNSIKPIEDVPLPRDYPIIESIIKQDIEQMTGADALARGTQLQSRATFGEVQVRSNLLSLKLNERIATVDRFFLEIGKQMAAHIGGNYHKSRVIQITGLNGTFWVEIGNQNLKDEVDITMQTVSAPKRNQEVESQQRIQIFQYSMQMLPLIQAKIVPPDAIDFVELLKWTLEGFERVDIGRFFKQALSVNQPLQEVLTPDQLSPQMLGQPQQPQQSPEGAQPSNPQDLIRSLGQGNMAGLQAAGGVPAY